MRLVSENLERRVYVYEAELGSPLGMKLAEQPVDQNEDSGGGLSANRVVVCEVSEGSTAASAGVRVGDRIVAAGGSWGGGMWGSSTVDGVTAAVASRLRLSGDVRLRFERPFDNGDEVRLRSTVTETFTVELHKPLGVVLEERGEGRDKAVYVKATEPSGSALGRVEVGDKVVSVSASVGDGMWEARSVDGVVSATATRYDGIVKLKLERQVMVGTGVATEAEFNEQEDDDEVEKGRRRRRQDEEKDAGEEDEDEVAVSIGTTLEALEKLRAMDVSSESTRAVILERACGLVYKYGRGGGPDAVAKMSRVARVLFSAQVVPSNKFLNIAMRSLSRLGAPHLAVSLYDEALLAGAVPNLLVLTTLANALTPTERQRRQRSRTHARGGETAMSEEGAAAAAGQQKWGTERLVVAVAELEARKVVPDTFFLNQLMRCFLSNGLVAEAEDVFYRVLKAGGASDLEARRRPAPPDMNSFNIMIDGYARRGLWGKAADVFESMEPAEFTPDLRSYTALVRGYLVGEQWSKADLVLTSMEEESARDPSVPAPDLFLYNLFIEAYAGTLRWQETELALLRLRAAGLSPDRSTFAYLLVCLTRAGQPGRAIAYLEEMDQLGVPLDEYTSTMLFAAYAKAGDPMGAVSLLRRLKAEGRTKVGVKAWTAAMDACVRSGQPEMALALCAEMNKAQVDPDEVVYVMIIKAYGLQGQVRKAALLVAALQREAQEAATQDAAKAEKGAEAVGARAVPRAVPVGVALYNALLSEAVQAQNWAIATGTLAELLARFTPNGATYAALVAESPADPLSQWGEGKKAEEGGHEEVGGMAMRTRFLLEAVYRLKDAALKRKSNNVRIAGDLYVTCLSEALGDHKRAATTTATAVGGAAKKGSAEEAAVALIVARRRGEVLLRSRDEMRCIEAEREWERTLGSVISGGEWQAVKLFEDIA